MFKNIIKSILIVLVVICGLFFFSLSNQLGGWRGFVVSSASMDPTLTTGSLVLTKAIQPMQLKSGDIITFISPTKDRQFITHRISKLVQKEKPISFKTKGDNNNNEDNWILAGGGVVGKVMVTVPYLGYLLSFSQTKLGIILFILLPALWILYDELLVIGRLFKNRKPVSAVSPETQGMIVLMLIGITSVTVITPTQALLFDKAALTNNTYTVLLVTPSPTLTPLPSNKPCNGSTTVIISGNESGSNSTVVVNNGNCAASVNQSNSTSATTTVEVSQTTGDNKISNNTVGSTKIITGDAKTEVISNVNGSVNSFNNE